MKKNIFLSVLALAALLAAVSCKEKPEKPGDDDSKDGEETTIKAKENTEDIKIERIMPPQASFYAMMRHTKEIDWSKHISTKEIIGNKKHAGYQTGIMFVNWTIASITKQNESVKQIASNWTKLTIDLEIDDSVILNAKENLDNIEKYLDKADKDSYRKMTKEIKRVYADIKEYYESKGQGDIVEQATFAVWMEFLYISINGFVTKYEEQKAELFNRTQEINYFLQMFEDKKGFEAEVDLLKSLKEPIQEGSGKMTKESLESITTLIEDFRSSRL